MKKALLLIGLSAVMFTANAQEGSFEVVANGQMQLTKGKYFISKSNDLKKKFKRGFGANLEGTYYVADGFSLGVELGFNSIKKHTVSGIKYKPKVLSALVKPRFYVSTTTRVRPYGELGIGLARMKLDASRTKDAGSAKVKDLTKNRIMIAPGAGVRIGLANNVDLNVGARYNFLKDYRHLQAMAGLAFRLN